MPAKHLRLVSRRFKSEYDAQTATNPNLVMAISDNFELTDHATPLIPLEINDITRLELDFRTICTRDCAYTCWIEGSLGWRPEWFLEHIACAKML